MIQQTSLSAYDDVKLRLGDKQMQVYLCLKDIGVANNLILSKRLKWDINRVTPRVLELREMGIIIKDSMRPCPITKRISWFWRIK